MYDNQMLLSISNLNVIKVTSNLCMIIKKVNNKLCIIINVTKKGCTSFNNIPKLVSQLIINFTTCNINI